jgi:hypothetical protein
MRYEVAAVADSERETLGPFALDEAKETVTRLAREAVGCPQFAAFVVPVPDDSSPAGKVGQ